MFSEVYLFKVIKSQDCKGLKIISHVWVKVVPIFQSFLFIVSFHGLYKSKAKQLSALHRKAR